MNSLDGIRILDLSRVLAGPWCTQTLADLGADVIKIERPGTGDDTRTWGPPFLQDSTGTDTAEAAYYLGTNRNKRSLTCVIAKPGGRALTHELVVAGAYLQQTSKQNAHLPLVKALPSEHENDAANNERDNERSSVIRDGDQKCKYRRLRS